MCRRQYPTCTVQSTLTHSAFCDLCPLFSLLPSSLPPITLVTKGTRHERLLMLSNRVPSVCTPSSMAHFWMRLPYYKIPSETPPVVRMSGTGIARVERHKHGPPVRGTFCCLIGNSLKGNADKETYVFIASDVVYTTVLHNQRLTSVKETRGIAPFWHIVLSLGPFPTSAMALQCAQRWVNCTRGCSSKIKRGIKLSQEYRVDCYADSVQPPGGTLKFLQRHLPRAYARTYKTIASAKHVNKKHRII
jgi:hypothetical protein